MHQDREERHMDVPANGRVGPGAREAASALTEALKDKHTKVREYAAKALERLQGGK
jgi:hypothetical protein